MTLGRRGRRPGGTPGRAERLLAGTLLAVFVAALAVGIPGRVEARMDDSDRAAYEATLETLQSRVYALYGWYHSVGQALVHVSNLGFFGRFGVDLDNPSCEWPAGSNNEYLYAAGLWVGGIVSDRDTGRDETHVSAAVYQVEFRPNPDDLLETIYETWEGAANSTRLFDDDGDCSDHLFRRGRTVPVVRRGPLQRTRRRRRRPRGRGLRRRSPSSSSAACTRTPTKRTSTTARRPATSTPAWDFGSSRRAISGPARPRTTSSASTTRSSTSGRTPSGWPTWDSWLTPTPVPTTTTSSRTRTTGEGSWTPCT